jgi:iron complex outermembrane receptor protein
VEGGDLRFSENLFNLTGVAFVTDNTEVFGGFSQGFSVADIGRAIRDGTATQAEQLESEAQKVDNYELGVRTRQGRFSGSLTGFFSESENGTTFDSDLNIAKTPERIWGVEASADMRVHDRLTLGGSLTWQQGVVDLDNDGDYEQDLPSTRVPPVKVTSYVEYALFDWWNARLQGLYSGHRAPDSSRFGGGDVDAYALADFYSSFDTGYGQIELAVENLFNADYFPVVSQATATTYGFVKGPGRTVSVSYSVEW